MEMLVLGESDHLQIGAGSGERCDDGDDDGVGVPGWDAYIKVLGSL